MNAPEQSQSLADSQIRIYQRSASAVFLKTSERWGGLSNMASGFPIVVNRHVIANSEALYQTCRFPHMPSVQRKILDQKSPMTAKMVGKPFRDRSRDDWAANRTRFMRWCINAKLVCNFEKFSSLLLETGDLPIVEESRRDQFWGAKKIDDEILQGSNVLGRLLMELRNDLRQLPGWTFRSLEPLDLPNFLLLGEPIQMIHTPDQIHLVAAEPIVSEKQTDQASLF